MVIIQPFQYEKTTAFKERVQIANKVNEIISLFNELDIESKINIFNEEIAIINTKITEINKALNDVNNAVNTVEGYNTRLTSVENESISLDARLDNIEPVVSSNTAKIGVLETKDLENVKLSGNQTIEDIKTYTKSPIVPNPPSGDTSTKAVNTNWISQSGNNAPNNLIHKIGNEVFISGTKLFDRSSLFLDHGKLYHASNTDMQLDKFYELFTCPYPNGDARAIIEIITLNDYGIISISQIGTNESSALDKVGTLLSSNNIQVIMIVEDNMRKLYIKKSILGDIIVSVKNFNIAGEWKGVVISDGYIVRE